MCRSSRTQRSRTGQCEAKLNRTRRHVSFTHRVMHFASLALMREYGTEFSRQAESLISFGYQHQPASGADTTTVEGGDNLLAMKASESELRITMCHSRVEVRNKAQRSLWLISGSLRNALLLLHKLSGIAGFGPSRLLLSCGTTAGAFCPVSCVWTAVIDLTLPARCYNI